MRGSAPPRRAMLRLSRARGTSRPIAVTQSCLSKVLLSLGSLATQQLFASTKFYLALTRAEAVPPRLLLTVMFSGLAIPLNFAL